MALVAQAPKPAAAPDVSEYVIKDPPSTSPVARILAEVADHQQALANLEELADDFGPRVTGSARLRQAQAWAMDKLKAYGAVNVHEEAYDFGPSWTRGREHARLLNGNGLVLHLAQGAWTPATAGLVQGEVVILEPATLEDLKAALPGLEGRIVLVAAEPKPDAEQKKDRRAFGRTVKAVLAGAKALAILRPSGKKNDLLNMTGSPVAEYGLGATPVAFLAEEHANLLKRLARRGRHPRLELELGGTFSDRPVTVYNVVAELKGTTSPDEVVLVGGHQDSWDLATGASDNGTGTVVAMETLRAIAALGLKPRRTLRVVLFSGEEEGLLGSKAYVKAHAGELDHIQAVLVDDMGSGRITGWPDAGKEANRAILARAMAPVNGLGCKTIGSFTVPGGTDHYPFHQAGVPAFVASQEFGDYMTVTHHSQVDSLDHVVADDLVQGCQVMAAMAWAFLEMEDRAPHSEPAK